LLVSIGAGSARCCTAGASSSANPHPGEEPGVADSPGCGKSTLLRRLQLDDTRQCFAEGSDRVSLFVSLGEYPLDRDPARNAPRPLDWLQAQWHRQTPCLPDLEVLLGERRVLLLLDALNEMPHRDVDDFRERIEQWHRFLRDDFPPGKRGRVGGGRAWPGRAVLRLGRRLRP
jgi:hypothetical protein